MIEKRSIPMAIIFTILTCGIYEIYWNYKIWDSLYRANGLPSSAGVDVLLSIVTCGIYGLYMLYKAGKMESDAFKRYDLGDKDDSVLYIVLAIFSFGIISNAILQSSINNQLADRVNAELVDPQRGPY